jgi:hypothetical protein
MTSTAVTEAAKSGGFKMDHLGLPNTPAPPPGPSGLPPAAAPGSKQ